MKKSLLPLFFLLTSCTKIFSVEPDKMVKTGFRNGYGENLVSCQADTACSNYGYAYSQNKDKTTTLNYLPDLNGKKVIEFTTKLEIKKFDQADFFLFRYYMSHGMGEDSSWKYLEDSFSFDMDIDIEYSRKGKPKQIIRNEHYSFNDDIAIIFEDREKHEHLEPDFHGPVTIYLREEQGPAAGLKYTDTDIKINKCLLELKTTYECVEERNLDWLLWSSTQRVYYASSKKEVTSYSFSQAWQASFLIVDSKKLDVDGDGVNIDHNYIGIKLTF